MSDMPEDDLTVIPEEADTTAEDYIDPEGDDPKDIPDPMPESLQPTPEIEEEFERQDSMEGQSPTS